MGGDGLAIVVFRETKTQKTANETPNFEERDLRGEKERTPLLMRDRRGEGQTKNRLNPEGL